MKSKNEVKKLERQVKKLEREVRELKKIVLEYMTEPKRAILEFLGIGDGEVLTREGLGVEYVRIVEKIIEKRTEEEGTGEKENASGESVS